MDIFISKCRLKESFFSFFLSLLINESYKNAFTKFSLNIGPSQIFDWNQRFTPANTPLF
jgi:hypothetical protein